MLGTKSKVDTVNGALRIVAGAHDEDRRRRFDDLLDLLGNRLAETDVRTEAWR